MHARHAWRTVFVASIRGALAPATMLSYPTWEQKVVQGILNEHLNESKKLKDKLKKRNHTPFVHYLILFILCLALISYRLIHTIQMIFVQISARIDITFPPVVLENVNEPLHEVNGTVYGLSFYNTIIVELIIVTLNKLYPFKLCRY